LRGQARLVRSPALMSNRPRLVRVAVCVAVGLGLISFVDARGFRKYFRLEREVRAIAERNRRLSEQNESLKREIQALRSDPEAIERAAREELGFTKPDEMVIKLE